MIYRRDFAKLAAIALAAAALPPFMNFETEDNMQLSEILLKIADNKQLTPQEKESLRLMADETQQRNSFIAGNTTPSNTLNIKFPFAPIYSEVFATDKAAFTIPIPADYKHLILVSAGRTTSADNFTDPFRVQYNGDTGTNYITQSVYGTSTTAAALEGLTQAYATVGALAGGGTSAGKSATCFTFFPHYGARNIHKGSIMIQAGNSSGGGYTALLQASFWKDTSPIQSMYLFPSSGDIASGSVVSLYGIA